MQGAADSPGGPDEPHDLAPCSAARSEVRAAMAPSSLLVDGQKAGNGADGEVTVGSSPEDHSSPAAVCERRAGKARNENVLPSRV